MITENRPQLLIGIGHHKTLDDHPLPIRAWHKSLRSVDGNGSLILARRDVGTVV